MARSNIGMDGIASSSAEAFPTEEFDMLRVKRTDSLGVSGIASSKSGLIVRTIARNNFW